MTAKITHEPDKAALVGPLERYDVLSLLQELRAEREKGDEDRRSKLLFQGFGIRVIVVSMRNGAAVAAHKAGCALSLLVLEGKMRFETEGESATLESGQLLTVEPGVRHELEALRPAGFVLTLAGDEQHPVQL